MTAKTIKVDTLARVEGEGALLIKIAGDRLTDVKLRIYEPPRFFEAFLRGRSYTELADIVARICGICPVAYQTSAIQAVEQAFATTLDPQVKALRRLLYLGEWIESHALHIYLLHAPDFLGFEDGIALAAKYPALVRRGLEAKKAGNELMIVLGGREIHPISMCPGGFYKVPRKTDLERLTDSLRQARDIGIEAVRWVSKFDFPDLQQDYEFVALRAAEGYPISEGRLVSNKGLDIEIGQFEDHFVEKHVSYSNALHCMLRARGSYNVGPLARFNLNYDRLPESVRQLATESGIAVPCLNPFQGIVVRALELVYACEEALRIIEAYEPPESPRAPVEVKAGVGHGCSEAPRGILYHRYEFDHAGRIVSARIVPPTSQNQKRIEDDLRAFIPGLIGRSDEEVKWKCEQAVRNYDPCISCATHAVKVSIEREPSLSATAIRTGATTPQA